MSMEKNDALFLLVKSLSKSEKRQFKLYAGRLGGNSEKNFMALFTLLDKMEEFDENEIYPYRIEGLGKNLIPTATDFDYIDKFVKVTDEGSAHTARELATSEGLFAGYTSGAAVEGLKQLAEDGEFSEDLCSYHS